MADLKETDEEVEKAGRGLIPRGGSSRTFRRALTAQNFSRSKRLGRATSFLAGRSRGNTSPYGYRSPRAGVYKANADPVETLYAEIEKARGLLKVPTKRNQFRGNAGTARASKRFAAALDRHHSGRSLNARSGKAPTRKRVMGYRLQNALRYLDRRSRRNAKRSGLSYGDR